ncbi:DNA (cytosine-5)-methyltransferase 1 [Lysobacter sp. OAE881]|uniref:DNA cytosine methyltransferase n=1 Tax=Lysobacter sp. OAE881 TaxID=2663813 RepID=UPI0019D8BF9C
MWWLVAGLGEAGFFPVFVNELNDDARQTYIANRDSINPLLKTPGFHAADVKSMVVDEAYVPELQKRLKKTFGIGPKGLDLLVGGPPCQGFSGIGHRRSYSVEKKQLPSNHLFQDMAALVHKLQPKAFVFENVRGLLNAKWTDGGRKGEIWEMVLKTFQDLQGYRVAYQLVFAKDYGVPQNRPRVLMVGIRDDIKSPLLRESVSDVAALTGDAVARGFLPPPGQKRAPDPVALLGDLVDVKYENGGATLTYPRAATTEIQKWLRTDREGKAILSKGAPVTEHDYSKHAPRVLAKFQAMIDSEDGLVPEEFRTKKFAQRLLPKRWGSEGPTITATSLPDDYVHFEQPRILTVREWARLQMFPDWYEFKGKKSTGGIRRAGNPREGVFDREVPKYTQIGNAVPVGLAHAVGEHLAKILRA